ncbi:hypothetical protein NF27_BK00420 [Candidatus Jidaibacter acanthamoeba]|uniref:Ribonuclease P protein component n=1 Tax=Candidatus Jidaibacter acanthamoebae TaxID=86105 RepID=A0A0C1N165_9RICK|nr:ribonuclease P protein component [Candidatus Jidaibacter acanthamoeba]KIE06121.1 hypothetical protein NF27_BK00420 [Candidatus Jidaibacter acanthamoeba]
MNLERIVKTKDYSRISKNSRKLHSRSFLILYNLLMEDDLLKVGFTVSKRVGNAVKRNYCKRLIRVITKEIIKENKFKPAEIIIIARPNLIKEKYINLKNEFVKGLENLR